MLLQGNPFHLLLLTLFIDFPLFYHLLNLDAIALGDVALCKESQVRTGASAKELLMPRAR